MYYYSSYENIKKKNLYKLISAKIKINIKMKHAFIMRYLLECNLFLLKRYYSILVETK